MEGDVPASEPAPLSSGGSLGAVLSEKLLRDWMLEERLDCCGVSHLPVDTKGDFFLRWIAEGQHGDMDWLARDPARRIDPQKVLPGANSLLVFGLNYYQPEPQRSFRIAKYALGKDYHKILLKKLKRICERLREMGGVNRPYVDTGPVLEKRVAAGSGIGWQGKNTLLLNENFGQWLFLGVILTSLKFPTATPSKDRCGTCTRCLEVCPTQAFTAPYQLDARRCIAYLTIEHKGSIPMEFREAIGDYVFGCDDCLDVCPWNRWAQTTREHRFLARDLPDLIEMLEWSIEEFEATFAGTPIRRLGLERWKRNICVVLGNTAEEAALSVLEKWAQSTNPLISEHAEWAVAQIQKRKGLAKLKS